MTGPHTGGEFDSIEEFASTAEGVVSTGQDLDEANTKAKILTPLVRTLGWPVYDNDEVLLEYSGDGQFDDRADYALFDANGLYAVIEAKQIGQPLSGHDSQIRRYMRLHGAEWGLLTNGEDYRIYQSEDETGESLVESLSLANLSTSEYLQHFNRETARASQESPALIDGMSKAQMKEIIELSNEPDIYEKVVGSVAPAVYGYEIEKLALAFALVGGVEKPEESARQLSGGIDVLLAHDPNTQFTELIDSINRIAPGSAYFSDSPLKVDNKPLEEKSLIATERPKYGRFDLYEPIFEQLALGSETLSSFDLIFTIIDQPDRESDRKVARHIIESNRAGELHVRDAKTPGDVGEELRETAGRFEPPINADLLKKYISYARKNCFPTMTEGAKTAIEDFYVNLRLKGKDENAPVPVSPDYIDTLVRLAEASARLRLSASIDEEDAKRAVELSTYWLRQIGVDPESGESDTDEVETGSSKAQRDRIKNIKEIITEIEERSEEGASFEKVMERVEEVGLDPKKAEQEIEKLRFKGEVYEPKQGHLRTS